jgi:hypothetical protein
MMDKNDLYYSDEFAIAFHMHSYHLLKWLISLLSWGWAASIFLYISPVDLVCINHLQHFPLLCKLMSIIYQILIIYIYSVPRCHISAGLCEVTSMCLFLCHLSCVPKRHLLAVSGEVLWLIVKLCGGTCTRASTAVCHGDSTRSLYSEWKLFWKWYTIQNLLLHRNTCFPESSHKPRVLPLVHRTGS